MANPIQAYLNTTSGPDDYREVTATDISPNKVAMDVAVKEGNFTVSGLNIAGKITHVTIDSDQWYAFPPTTLANRNALVIQNLSGIDVLLNYDNAAPSSEGITIFHGYERQYDIRTIVIYLRRKSGSGPIVVVAEELS